MEKFNKILNYVVSELFLIRLWIIGSAISCGFLMYLYYTEPTMDVNFISALLVSILGGLIIVLGFIMLILVVMILTLFYFIGDILLQVLIETPFFKRLLCVIIGHKIKGNT